MNHGKGGTMSGPHRQDDQDHQDDPSRSALFTDLYELTMARAYAVGHMDRPAVFEIFFRTMPVARNFILAAGLDDVLGYLESWRFCAGDLEYLRGLGHFPQDFLARLAGLRFTGDVFAAPEGTPVYENEPIVQVVAPLLQAQMVETFLLNQVHYQCVAASKAARVVLAASGRPVADFGSRRAHGADAALKAARAAYLAGAAGTSNLLAGKRYGLPVCGTMAHSFVQAYTESGESGKSGGESGAFEAFARLYPETTLLVDTFDTLEGVAEVVRLAGRMGRDFHVGAIRLDSGDLAGLARQARSVLDAAGLERVRIVATGELDEYAIAALLGAGAPIDAFGVGTRMVVSTDAPVLDMVYKLVEYDGTGRAKLSTGKAMYPGRKQVRRFMEAGRMTGDLVCRQDEDPGGEPLLRQVMARGVRTEAGRESLETCRARAAAELAALPCGLAGLARSSPYPVAFSAGLEDDLDDLKAARSPGRTPAERGVPTSSKAGSECPEKGGPTPHQAGPRP